MLLIIYMYIYTMHIYQVQSPMQFVEQKLKKVLLSFKTTLKFKFSLFFGSQNRLLQIMWYVKSNMAFYAVWGKKENKNRIKKKVRTFEKKSMRKRSRLGKGFGGWSVALMYSPGFWQDNDGFPSLHSTEQCPCPSPKWEDLSPDYELLIRCSSDDSLIIRGHAFDRA